MDFDNLLPSQQEALTELTELFRQTAERCEADDYPGASPFRRRAMQIQTKMITMHGAEVNTALTMEAYRRANIALDSGGQRFAPAPEEWTQERVARERPAIACTGNFFMTPQTITFTVFNGPDGLAEIADDSGSWIRRIGLYPWADVLRALNTGEPLVL